MHSSLDKVGFRLLNNWKTSEAEVRVSFSGIGNKLLISGSGVIFESSRTVLRFSGPAFEVFVDLADAAFEKVSTEEDSRLNLNARFLESVELLLASGDRVTFFGKERTLESGGVN